jgi:exodeoxyribonuclease VII large subunit
MMDFSTPSIYTVSQLTAEIKDILEGGIGEVWVEGEVSNLRVPPSGHWYFTLKDESSQIQVVVFRSQARFLEFEPEDGLRIIVRGRVSVYEQRGQYQLIVDFMEPRGLGALQLAFDQLKRRLEAEGLFDPGRKKPLPFLPKRIGIVTSPTGAVIRDMLIILKRRFDHVGVLLYPVRVQGEGAPDEIARGITYLDRQTDVDVIVVARGGGSMEDLWAFNDEAVARAIERAHKPVVSAVGHEVDFTISDFVADVRAPTPSVAAELVVRNKADLLFHLESLRDRLIKRIQAVLKGKKDLWLGLDARLRDPRRRLVELRLQGDDLLGRLVAGTRRMLERKHTSLGSMERDVLYKSPLTRIDRIRDRLEQRAGKLERATREDLELRRRALERSMDRLEAMSPLKILRRGYSIVRRLPSMDIIRDSRAVRRDEMVDVKLHQGRLVCRVESTQDEGESRGGTV